MFSIQKMVDIMDVYKYINVSIETVIKKAEMLNFFHDHLKTKKCVRM